ncbi:glycosyltransferase [Candidatus Methylomirabilis sp.]|uniref:glycosyltransferase family 2 protein n=1 Tax=Candidatus Methylomirabilis sp. TaxID=2032687 RepID=UPI002A66C680|nr:glycosyltransferase [Candidatus Methylomirabilis sp.]
MGTSPRVTVLIPVYNRERYVATAIESILAQSFIDFELLLIDDASTDGSVEILRTYTTDSRVRLVCNEQNLGIPRTRNRGIDLARGEYIAMLDSDDWAYPRRLEKQVAFLDRHKDFAVVGAWATEMDENGRSLSRDKRRFVSPGELQSRLLFRCSLCNSSIMARTAVLREYRYREQYAVCEDFDLFVRVAKNSKLGNLPETLVHRRTHAGNLGREKAQLMKAKNQEIASAQLTELGVTFTVTDLERHFVLPRMTKLQFAPDREYLEWADAWLQKLQKVNRRVLRYPTEAFARLVGQLWVTACWRASGGMGWAAWKHFWRSPLSRGALASLKQNLFFFVFRRPLWET